MNQPPRLLRKEPVSAAAPFLHTLGSSAAKEIDPNVIAGFATLQYPSCMDCVRQRIELPRDRGEFSPGVWVPVSVCMTHRTVHLHCCVEDVPEERATPQDFRCPFLIRDRESNVCPYTGIVDSLGWCENDDLGYGTFKRTHRVGETRRNSDIMIMPEKKAGFVNKWLQTPGQLSAAKEMPDADEESTPRRSRNADPTGKRQGTVKDHIRNIIQFFTGGWRVEALADDECLAKKEAGIRKVQQMELMIQAVEQGAVDVDTANCASTESTVTDGSNSNGLSENPPYIVNLFDPLAIYLTNTSDWYNGAQMISLQRLEWLMDIVYVVGSTAAWVRSVKKAPSEQQAAESQERQPQYNWLPNINVCLPTTLAVLRLLSKSGSVVLHEKKSLPTSNSKQQTKTQTVSVRTQSRATILLPSVPELVYMLPTRSQQSKVITAWHAHQAQTRKTLIGDDYSQYRRASPSKMANEINKLLQELNRMAQNKGPLQKYAVQWMSKLAKTKTWFSPSGERASACTIRDLLR